MIHHTPRFNGVYLLVEKGQPIISINRAQNAFQQLKKTMFANEHAIGLFKAPPPSRQLYILTGDDVKNEHDFQQKNFKHTVLPSWNEGESFFTFIAEWLRALPGKLYNRNEYKNFLKDIQRVRAARQAKTKPLEIPPFQADLTTGKALQQKKSPHSETKLLAAFS